MDVSELKSRKGVVKVSHEFIFNPDVKTLLLDKLYIVRAESLYMEGVVEYWAYCEGFEAMPAGYETPKYIASFGYGEGRVVSVDLVPECCWEFYTDLKAGLITEEKYRELRSLTVQGKFTKANTNT